MLVSIICRPSGQNDGGPSFKCLHEKKTENEGEKGWGESLREVGGWGGGGRDEDERQKK